MGIVDKAKNLAQDLTGKGKETAGDVTNNEDLQAEGEIDQVKAKVNKTGESVKDTFKN